MKRYEETPNSTMLIMDRLHDLVKILEVNILQPQPRVRMALFFPDTPASFGKLYHVFHLIQNIGN